MAPGAECSCGQFRAKTKTEPASDQEIEALMNKGAGHIAERENVNTALSMADALSDKKARGSRRPKHHLVYHSVTPKDGSFDEAEVV